MTFTVVFILICLLASIAWLALDALLLKWGLGWAKAEGVTFRQSLRVVLVGTIVALCIAGLEFTLFGFDTEPLAETLVFLAIQIAAWLFLLRLFFATGLWRSVQASLPMIVSPILALLFAALVFKPFLFECFIVPTNSMAPTIVGAHYESVCDSCGSKAFAHARASRFADQPVVVICNKFHSNSKLLGSGEPVDGDRIVTAKFLRPIRWDIATFRYPADPKVSYVKRVVGLPGETIYVSDGSVYINGEKLDPPQELSGIQFDDRTEYLEALHATVDNPAVLGPDEYFVVGDNTREALDSRFWSRGAPGHNAFAVPESHMTGVVTSIYWPPSRWASFK